MGFALLLLLLQCTGAMCKYSDKVMEALAPVMIKVVQSSEPEARFHGLKIMQ